MADTLGLGFLPGFREDCGYQEEQYQNLSLPVGMLDNEFRNPDLERFVDQFFEYEPDDVDDDTKRSKREVEAEAVAYIVGRYCELDTRSSAFYLVVWEPDDPESVCARSRIGLSLDATAVFQTAEISRFG